MNRSLLLNRNRRKRNPENITGGIDMKKML